jgi:3-methyladenine DNA glycosylase AlkD
MAHGTAHHLLAELQDAREQAGDGEGHPGPVPMRAVFALAKRYTDLPVAEIEHLLQRDEHDARVAAVSVMDHRARRTRLDDEDRRALFDLYLRRHDRIDTWDLVDRAAPHVLGRWLASRPRDRLYTLAASEQWWERRSAIVATWYFIRSGELDDTFALGEILADDGEHFVQTAVGGWLREAGKRDPARLLAFLDAHADRMAPVALRFATEKLAPEVRRNYRAHRPAG